MKSANRDNIYRLVLGLREPTEEKDAPVKS